MELHRATVTQEQENPRPGPGMMLSAWLLKESMLLLHGIPKRDPCISKWGVFLSNDLVTGKQNNFNLDDLCWNIFTGWYMFWERPCLIFSIIMLGTKGRDLLMVQSWGCSWSRAATRETGWPWEQCDRNVKKCKNSVSNQCLPGKLVNFRYQAHRWDWFLVSSRENKSKRLSMCRNLVTL